MNKLCLFFCLVCFGTRSIAQADSNKWVRAFPIMDYVVDIGDSIKVVQVKPDNRLALIRDKQIGLLRGTYQSSTADTVTIGAGRCNLIKGDYYYFSIHLNRSGKLPRGGDLLYTVVERNNVIMKEC